MKFKTKAREIGKYEIHESLKMILGSMKKTERLSIDEKLWKLQSVSVTTAKNIKKGKKLWNIRIIVIKSENSEIYRSIWEPLYEKATKSYEILWENMKKVETIWNEMKNEQ